MKVLKFLTSKQKLGCVLVILLAALSAFLTSIWPVLLGEIYDDISTGNIFDIESGVVPFFTFGIAFAVAEICTIIRRVWTDQIGVSYEKHLRELSISKLLRLPSSFFGENVSGEITGRVNQSVTGSSQLVKVICNNIFPSILIGTFTIVQVIFKVPWFIIAIMISYIAVEIFISTKQIKSQNGVRTRLIGQKAKLDGCICQTIQNIELIRVIHAEEFEINRISPKTMAIKETESKHHLYMGMFDGIKQIVKVIYTVALLFTSILMVSNGTINGGMVITIILLFQQLVAPVDSIHIFLDEIASTLVKAKEFVKLIENEDDDIFTIESTFINEPSDNSDIFVKNVDVYAPGKSTKICSNVSAEFKSGSIIGVKGPTGCGKSSFLKAILRYYPSSGIICLGGQSLNKLPQESISNDIFYLTQQAIFFEGTLRENLIYGLSYIPTDEQLLFALKNSLIYSELKNKCDDVLQHPVFEGASNFSGGQKQRIAMARAFLRQPKWFFLDESTCNLDEKNEEKVLNNLENYAHTLGAGVVYISHSDNVMSRCDEIKNIQNVADAA